MFDVRKTPEGKKVLSMGYPRVEQLIDSEDFTKVNQTFEALYRSLEEISKEKRKIRRSREARKAMRSIELVMNLFKELLEIKYRLQEMLKKAAEKK